MTFLNENWIKASSVSGSKCPIFSKKVNIDDGLLSAAVSVTAIGIYNLYVNGKRVGNELYAPGWTSYHNRIMYQIYDISKYLEIGENEIAVHSAPGWAVGYLGRGNTNHKFFDHISVSARAELLYGDGRRDIVVTDKTWRVERGEVRSSEFYHGESRDLTACRELVEYATEDKAPKTKLVPDERLPVTEHERVAALKLIITPKGERVIDFGQNLAGYVEIRIKGNRGDRVTVSHAEVLDAEGNFYTTNLELARSTDTYVLSGKEDILKPEFSFHGYRYIRLDEYPFDIVDLSSFTSVAVYSDIKRTGDFVCGNTKINKLYSNTVWGQRSNFIDIPTDCPQRDERLGWTGDVLAFAKTAAINYDVKDFICKWLDDVMLEQGSDGAVSSVVPGVSGRGERTSTAWGDAAIVVPWELYLAYGDAEILKRYYPMMEGWISYMRAQGEEEYLWLGGWHYGDWLASDAILCPEVREGATQTDLIASAYYAYSVSLMVKICKVLGRSTDKYESLFRNIKKKFREFFMRDGLPVLYPKYDALSTTRPVKGLTQTSLTLVLKFGLYEGEAERQKLISTLLDEIKANGGCMNTGFVGTLYILQVLTENGAADKAYDLFLSEKNPSWLFSVNHGATTVWEHWDGIKDDGSFWDDSKNSFNHYAYGSVFGWVYEWVLGIKISEDGAGYKKIVIEPNVDERLGFARGSVKTQQGLLSVSWTFFDGRVRYELTVPEETEAIFIANGKEYICHGGSHCFETDAPTRKYRVMQYNILHQRKGWGADKYLDLGLTLRSENVKRAIAEENPDILVLAERHDEWAGVEVDFCDVSVNLSKDLKDTYTFVEDRIENGRTVNRTPIAYKKDIFRCIESGSHELGEEHSFERSQNKRVVSYAVLENLDTKNRLVVFSTHWSSGQPQELINMQSKNMQCIIKSIADRYCGLPVIVAADFNTLYNNEAYLDLLDGCEFSDADKAVNKNNMDISIVDHIALRDCKVLGFKKLCEDYTELASDHKPIICEIEVK